MSSWRYCSCGQGLSHPTDEEALTNEYTCPQCHSRIEVWEEERRDAYRNMLSRIKKLESVVYGAKKGI